MSESSWSSEEEWTTLTSMVRDTQENGSNAVEGDTEDGSSSGRCVIGTWFINHRCVIGTWFINSRCVIVTWLTRGRCVIRTWFKVVGMSLIPGSSAIGVSLVPCSSVICVSLLPGSSTVGVALVSCVSLLPTCCLFVTEEPSSVSPSTALEPFSWVMQLRCQSLLSEV
jgi:hypothetical protein